MQNHRKTEKERCNLIDLQIKKEKKKERVLTVCQDRSGDKQKHKKGRDIVKFERSREIIYGKYGIFVMLGARSMDELWKGRDPYRYV